MAVVLGGGDVVNVFFRSAQTKQSWLTIQIRPDTSSRGAFWANNIWFKSFSPSATAWLVAALRAFWALTPRQVNLSWDIDYFINIIITVFFLSQSHSKYILQPGCRWHEQVRPDWLYGMCGILPTYLGLVDWDVFGMYGQRWNLSIPSVPEAV